MVDAGSSRTAASGFWASPKLSWAFVILGMALLYVGRIPSLPTLISQWSGGMTSHDWMVLGYLCAASAISILGLWRLSSRLGLPKFLSLLYLVFPLAILAVYLVWPFVQRARYPR